MPRNAPAYEDDFVAWLEDQAQHARRQEIESLDLENIAEELEGMARSDRREIRNRLIVLTDWAFNYFTYDRGVRLITNRDWLINPQGEPVSRAQPRSK